MNTNTTILSSDDVLERLREFVSKHESQSAAARSLGISQPYLFEILKGTRSVSENVALKLGIRKDFYVLLEG